MPKKPKEMPEHVTPPPPLKKRKSRIAKLLIIIIILLVIIILLGIFGEGLGLGKGNGKNDNEALTSQSEQNDETEKETEPKTVNVELKVSGSTIIYDGGEVTADEAVSSIKSLEGIVIVTVTDDNATHNAMESLISALEKAGITYGISSSASGNGAGIEFLDN